VARPGLLALALTLTSAGCFTSAEGREPDGTRLYFPTGLLVSPGRSTLYVANSDFDLQFSGGSVQALDLAALREAVRVIPERIEAARKDETIDDDRSVAAVCEAAGLGLNGSLWLNPGPCSPLAVEPFIRSYAFIGAFASGLLLVHQVRPGTQTRLFVPVRGDPSITYFDVQDDRDAELGSFTPSFQLSCNAGEDGFCADEHRLGRDPDRSLRGIQLPADPVGIAANADGTAIVSAHQTQASASLIINDWDSPPYLSYFASNLPTGPTEVIALPAPPLIKPAQLAAEAAGLAFSYQEGFAVTYRYSAVLDILRYNPDAGGPPSRPFIFRSEYTGISTSSSNFDSRGIAIVDSDRRACEETCTSSDDELDCLVRCAEEIPLQVFLANRNPASLLLGTVETIISTAAPPEGEPESVITGATEEISFYDSLPLNFGPSRVEVGAIINEAGELEDRVFVVCFDSRTIFSVDPKLGRVESVIATGRGPHDIAFDTGDDYSYLYVGHFTDSYLGVVDLDQRRPLTYGQMIASVGTPTPPTESR